MIHWKIFNKHGTTVTLEALGYYIPLIFMQLYWMQSHSKLYSASKSSSNLFLKGTTLFALEFKSSLYFSHDPCQQPSLTLVSSSDLSHAYYLSWPNVHLNHIMGIGPSNLPIEPSDMSPEIRSILIICNVVHTCDTLVIKYIIFVLLINVINMSMRYIHDLKYSVDWWLIFTASKKELL